jgi:hypothetical protein
MLPISLATVDTPLLLTHGVAWSAEYILCCALYHVVADTLLAPLRQVACNVPSAVLLCCALLLAMHAHVLSWAV